jgi:hypothetical protein
MICGIGDEYILSAKNLSSINSERILDRVDITND